MAEYNKEKLYFLKLPKDFFQSYKMRALEGLQSGKDYELMYLKLICESVSHNGYLRFDEKTPYTAEMIAGITNTPIDTVRVGIAVLQQFGLVEMTDAMTIYMPEVPNMTGSTTEGAKRKSLYRQRQTSLPQPDGTKGGQEGDICPPREIRELDNGLSTNVSKPTENLRESTSSPKGSSVASPLKPVKTSYKQSALCEILVKFDFLKEDELRDPQWDNLLDRYVAAYGFQDTKIKLQYALKRHSRYVNTGTLDQTGRPLFRYEFIQEDVASKYPWLEAAMDSGFEKFERQGQANEEWRKAIERYDQERREEENDDDKPF